MTTEAYVMIAYGDKYVLEAVNLVKSIKKFDNTRHFVLVSNIASHELFDKVVNVEHEFVNEANNHNKFCVLARIMAPKYIEYDRFVMIDTDILCMNHPEYMWNTFKSNDNCFNCICGRDGSAWHWGHIDRINQQNNLSMLPMHGGIIYFNKTSEKFAKYYEDLLYGLSHYDQLGFKRQFRNQAMTDEVIISYANAKNEIIPFDFANYPIVSFNLNHTYSVSEHIISWGTSNTTFKTTGPTLFNHFTGLNEYPHIGNLYNKWLEKLKI